MIEELKQEEAKYHKLYEEKSQILDELKADAFKLAINQIEKKGLKETYLYFKAERDKHSQDNKLSRNLSHAYSLVVGKLWKYYKNVQKE